MRKFLQRLLDRLHKATRVPTPAPVRVRARR